MLSTMLSENEKHYKKYDSSYVKRILRMWHAPRSIFFTYAVAFVLLVGNYAYFLMYDYCDGTPSRLEMFLLVWVLTLFVDEIRQVYETPTKELGSSIWSTAAEIKEKFKNYYKGKNQPINQQKLNNLISGEVWDLFDMGYLLLFIIAFLVKNGAKFGDIVDSFGEKPLRLYDTCIDDSLHHDEATDSTAHILYGISFYLLILRSTHMLSLNRTIGPQV